MVGEDELRRKILQKRIKKKKIEEEKTNPYVPTPHILLDECVCLIEH